MVSEVEGLMICIEEKSCEVMHALGGLRVEGRRDGRLQSICGSAS